MKQKIFLLFLFICTLPIRGQEGFLFEKGVDKVVIPFQFINNLIFIPLKVNGIELNFLLDSGVEETILFSMEELKEVSFSNVEKVSLRGLGSKSSVEGLKSTGNILEVNGLKSSNHLVYVILDESFNLSSHIGIPVNGIIGYQFLKSNLIEINYERKRIIVYRDNTKYRKNIERKFQEVPITIERNKPYLYSNVIIDSNEIPTKLLIDIGNGDALWLFENESKGIIIPQKNFKDYLGKGFSGDVEGKRAQIKKFSFSKFEFNKPIVAYPDSTSIKNVRMVEDRSGSVGSEILKRFTAVFDYPNKKLFLKKMRNFNSIFNYNKSGIEIQHSGLQWVQETVSLKTVPINGTTFDSSGNNISNNFKYKFALKPIYEIIHIRDGSPAATIGLQIGDVIISINKVKAYKYSLQEINNLLRPEDEKWVAIEVERESKVLIFKFQLINVF